MISYEGNKIRLRPLKSTDIENSIHWRNDPHIRENSIGYRFPVTEEMEEKWYESALDDQSQTRVLFAIELLDNCNLVGFVYLNNIDWISRYCYFGIVVGEKEHHGKGLAVDSMQVLFSYCFDCLNLRKIYLEVVSYNKKGMDLYKKFGFFEEGRLKDHIYLSGSYHDLVIMRIFDYEFRNKYMMTE